MDASDQVAILLLEDDVTDAQLLLVPKSTFESSLRKLAPSELDDGFRSLTAWFMKQLKPHKGKHDPRRSTHEAAWAVIADWMNNDTMCKCMDPVDCHVVSPCCFLCVRSDHE